MASKKAGGKEYGGIDAVVIEVDSQPSKEMELTMTFSPLFPENSPTILSWQNLTVTSKADSSKVLLNNISGTISGTQGKLTMK